MLTQRLGITDILMTLGLPVHSEATGELEYFVAPATLTFKVPGKQVSQDRAIFTVALRKDDSRWPIAAWAWTKGAGSAFADVAREPVTRTKLLSMRSAQTAACIIHTVLLFCALFLIVIPCRASAQDDGARLYMLIPDKTTIASMRVHHLHSNLAVDPGVIAQGDHLDTTLVVFQFVQTLKIASGQSSVFFVLPVSRIKPDYAQPASAPDTVSGLGDAQLGFVLGVYGTPALTPEAYAEHKPGLAVNLLAKAFFPTGDYEAKRPINVGANRWALRLGVPMVYTIGERMSDPHLTTLEVMPTVTFFGRNDDPIAANSTKQKPLFILEAHLTRGFSRKFWASLDLLWRRGGEVEFDGVGADNSQHALSLGATGTFALSRNASIRVSYGGVVDRNAHGPNGWILRTVLGFTF